MSMPCLLACMSSASSSKWQRAVESLLVLAVDVIAKYVSIH
jgi:hypothetical protein